MKKDKRNGKLIIPIIIASIVIGVGVILRIVFTTSDKTESVAEKATSVRDIAEVSREDVSKSTEQTEIQAVVSGVYIVVPERVMLPATVKQKDIFMSSDGSKSIRYEALVQAARREQSRGLELEDINGNRLLIAGANALTSDTGRVAVKKTIYTDGNTQTTVEEYYNLTVEEFRELVNSTDPRRSLGV